MIRKITSVLLIAVFFFAGCKKEVDDHGNNNNGKNAMESLVVPVDFKWETSQDIQVIVNVQTTKIYQPKYKVSVFSANPQAGGKAITSGSAGGGKSFTDKITFPSYMDKVFLVCEGPYGSYHSQEVMIDGAIINYTFSDSRRKDLPTGTGFKNTTQGPDCDEGCDEYISGGGNHTLSGGKTYCIAENFDGNITFNWNSGATLRICAVANINNSTLSLSPNSHIVVAEGGTLFAGNVEMHNNATLTVYGSTVVEVNKIQSYYASNAITNFGSIGIAQNSYHSGPVENYGTMTYVKNFDLNGTSLINEGVLTIQKYFISYSTGATILNNGTMNVTKKFELDNNAQFTNNGTLNAGDDFWLNDNSKMVNGGTISIVDNAGIYSSNDFVNNCQVTVGGWLEITNNARLIMNSGYLKINEKCEFYNNTNEFNDGSLLKVEDDLVIEADLVGSGGLNSIIVMDRVDIWGNGVFVEGQIELAIQSGELHSGGPEDFIDGAYFTSIEEALNYLPITVCNPDGFGTPTIVDSDSDGIPDETDAYPFDPDRAFNSYFPEEGSYATVAFEDLWPAQGDYDFNDLVVAVYGTEVTNADDGLVDIYINFIVKAVGASLNNGFGFQLGTIAPGMIASVTGMVLNRGYVTLSANGTEAGQQKTVVIVTESIEDVIHRAGGSMFNTVENGNVGTSDTTEIVIMFDEPIDRNLFGPEAFNPFLIKSQNRSVEIHLTDNPPTDLMDMELFGTLDDDSNPATGRYYVTANNLPWGLLILEPFDYPIEKSPIISAYNYFAEWAETGGSTYEDWYHNQPGYRNTVDIYTP